MRNTQGGAGGNVNLGLYKEKDRQEFNQNVLLPHVFGDYSRKIRVSNTRNSVMYFSVRERCLSLFITMQIFMVYSRDQMNEN